eukprot:17779-Heterococcus_DN1.PRE.1
MSSTEPFALSAELLGHEGPVRALALLDGGRLATGSQDKTAKVTTAKVNLSFTSFFDRVLCNSVLLGLNNSSPSFDRCLPQQIWQHSGATGAASFYEAEHTLQDHTHWVTALIALPPNMLPETPEGGVITGCLDRVIRIYNLGQVLGVPLRALQGHEGGVISLRWDHTGTRLLSGSWDGTARIWDIATSECIAILPGHENGVCVLGLPNGNIATGSTGKQDSGKVVDFQMCLTVRHTCTICWCYCNYQHYFDVHIRLWGADGKQIKTLREHTGPVRSLDIVQNTGGFMSTSNDGTAMLWSLDGQQLAVMPHPPSREGQPSFVLSGCSLATGECVTVDEGGTCIIWRDCQRLVAVEVSEPSVAGLNGRAVYKAHSTCYCARPAALLIDHALWYNLVDCVAVVGTCVNIAHQGVCSIHCTADIECTCLCYKQAVQTIKHPSSLWHVVALPNGDFVTACQDHGARIFTRAPERVAAAEIAIAFEAAVSEAQTAAARGPSDIEIAKLPVWDNRHTVAGGSEGRVQVFQREGKAIAAQWSAASGAWVEIGELTRLNPCKCVLAQARTIACYGRQHSTTVVCAMSLAIAESQPLVTGSTDSGTLDGQSYDHVFPIEIEGQDGAVKNLKLGYNIGENPFTTAQGFIDKHMLPQVIDRKHRATHIQTCRESVYLAAAVTACNSNAYLAQVADYIIKRAGQPPPTLGGSTQFTAQNQQPAGGFSGVGDPTGFATNVSNSYGSSGSGNSAAVSKHFPVKSYLVFETGDVSKIVVVVVLELVWHVLCIYVSAGMIGQVEAKVVEFNGQLVTDSTALNNTELSSLSALCATLKATSRYHSSRVTPDQMKLVSRLLSWPADKPYAMLSYYTDRSVGEVFPCLDLVRLNLRTYRQSSHVAAVSTALLYMLHCYSIQCTRSYASTYASAMQLTTQHTYLTACFNGAQFVQAVAEHCTPQTPPIPAPLCGLRLLANLFKLRHTRSLALSTLSTQLDAAAEGTGTSSSGGLATPKTVRLAAATLLLNAAVAITQ